MFDTHVPVSVAAVFFAVRVWMAYGHFQYGFRQINDTGINSGKGWGGYLDGATMVIDGLILGTWVLIGFGVFHSVGMLVAGRLLPQWFSENVQQISPGFSFLAFAELPIQFFALILYVRTFDFGNVGIVAGILIPVFVWNLWFGKMESRASTGRPVAP